MRFIVFGDSKGQDNGINEKILTELLKHTSNLSPQPEFIVMCGDNVAGSMEEETLISQLQGLKKLIRKYHPNIPVMPVVGNHEVAGKPVDERFEIILSKEYGDLTPDGFLQGYNKTVYYKDFGDARLIVLNSFHYGEAHRIGKEQLSWLEEVISQEKRYKFVFVHSPAYPTGAHADHCLDSFPEARNHFWNIVDKHHVDIVFSGHEHNYSRRVIGPSVKIKNTDYKNNIYQIITGGAGEKLRDKYKSKSGVIIPPIAKHHFVLVDIISNGIQVSAVTLAGKSLDKFIIE